MTQSEWQAFKAGFAAGFTAPIRFIVAAYRRIIIGNEVGV